MNWLINNISRYMTNPKAQIVIGLLPALSSVRRDPAKSIPMTLTIRMRFRPVEKATVPRQVGKRIISIIVYMVNPHMHGG